MSYVRHFFAACAILAISMTAAAGVIDPKVPAISYVSFQSPDLGTPGTPLTISGQLRVPQHDSPTSQGIPAVVVLHGSAGIDSRGNYYAQALNDAGIATLEIDMWAARNLTGGADRPALPSLTVPDAFSALKYLADNPAIDANRIGVLGFSWGGVVSLLSATQYYTAQFGDGHAFAAHVANYPVCWAYSAGIPGIFFSDLTGAPVLVQVGNHDDYDDGPGPCRSLAAPFDNVSVEVYSNAYHGWDRLQPAITVTDPFSHLGAGGQVKIAPNPGEAHQSRSNVVDFFTTKFGMH